MSQMERKAVHQQKVHCVPTLAVERSIKKLGRKPTQFELKVYEASTHVVMRQWGVCTLTLQPSHVLEGLQSLDKI